MYNTCPHLCRYCYANFSDELMMKNCRQRFSKKSLMNILQENNRIKRVGAKRFAIGRSSHEIRIKAHHPRRRHGHLAGGADERSLVARAPEGAFMVAIWGAEVCFREIGQDVFIHDLRQLGHVKLAEKAVV